MTRTANNDCLGVVLAGGLSSRMGQDKAKLLRDKHSMLAFSKQILLESGISNVVISGDNYQIPDNVKESGPVGGILSVLSRFPHIKSLLILPVDLPLMKASALTELRVKGELSHKATYFKGHNIPLFLPNNSYVELFLAQAFTPSSCTAETQEGRRFKNKGPSIKALLNQIPHQAIHCNDSNMLFNTNTPEEWQQARKQFNF